MIRPQRIVITTGDIDGVGTEIAAKALYKTKPHRNFRYILWRSPSCPKAHLRKMENHFERVSFSSWPEALRYSHDDHRVLIDICSDLSPAHWVELSAKAALYGHIDAMVTGPLSKTTIQQSGMEDIGHTDILKRIAKKKDVFMGFFGDKMSVVLATGHIPVAKVGEQLTATKLLKALRAAHALEQVLSDNKKTRPVGLLGLNPHAGEDGVIGEEENKWHRTALKKAQEEGLKVEGPLVPDVCFQAKDLKKYFVYVANYHDQGLIPFKMIHQENRGVQISLGLPFIRTSVDHGTAKNIFNKNKASYASMLQALQLATKICSNAEVRNVLTSL